MKKLNCSEVSVVFGGVTEGPNGEGCTEPRTGTKGKQTTLLGNTLDPQIAAF